MTQVWPISGLLHDLVTAEGGHGPTSSGRRGEVVPALPLPSCWPLLGPIWCRSSPVRRCLWPSACRASRAL